MKMGKGAWLAMAVTWAPAIWAWIRSRQWQVRGEVDIRGEPNQKREMKPGNSVSHLWNASHFTRAFPLISSKQPYVELKHKVNYCPLCQGRIQQSERLIVMALLNLLLGRGWVKCKHSSCHSYNQILYYTDTLPLNCWEHSSYLINIWMEIE